MLFRGGRSDRFCRAVTEECRLTRQRCCLTLPMQMKDLRRNENTSLDQRLARSSLEAYSDQQRTFVLPTKFEPVVEITSVSQGLATLEHSGRTAPVPGNLRVAVLRNARRCARLVRVDVISLGLQKNKIRQACRGVSAVSREEGGGSIAHNIVELLLCLNVFEGVRAGLKVYGRCLRGDLSAHVPCG